MWRLSGLLVQTHFKGLLLLMQMKSGFGQHLQKIMRPRIPFCFLMGDLTLMFSPH